MAIALVFLPLIGALYAGLLCRKISARHAQIVTTGLLFGSAILATKIFYQVVMQGQVINATIINWMVSDNFTADWAVYVDSLTATMFIVVTWVSALVHLYSVGYMSHDPHNQRFFSYLSLFTFFMLMLVSANNLLQLFLGWEGVGLCSYLLIGFWFHKPSANAAAMKAFIVNRVGDFGFLLGIFAIFILFGSIEFDTIFGQAADHRADTFIFFNQEFHALSLICFLLFIGCMGKSAQFGLHTWLPDAMEGPTPVSALIHAATMVTAGVFLIARCSPLFEYAPDVLMIVTVVGAFTCVFAASIGLVQNDIKRIIAYSTCSQLGYMFFACGVSAYSAGIFHLMTHGFFKALLFLSAGSVIHACSDEHDIRKMGGLWKKLKITHAVMIIGSLAIVGIWPFAGFFSKDAILLAAWWSKSPVAPFAFWMGIGAAFMTAFYSWRLLILTFYGESRASKKVQDHVHESPAVILIPLILLAIGAVGAGYWGENIMHIMGYHLEAYWGAALTILPENNILEHLHDAPAWVIYLPLVIGIAGILTAYLCYMWAPGLPVFLAKIFRPLYLFLLNKWYIDELYDFLFVRPAKALGTFLWQGGDQRTIDGLGPNGLAWLTQSCGKIVSRFQTGYVYHYAFVMLLGVIGFITYYLVRFL